MYWPILDIRTLYLFDMGIDIGSKKIISVGLWYKKQREAAGLNFKGLTL